MTRRIIVGSVVLLALGFGAWALWGESQTPSESASETPHTVTVLALQPLGNEQVPLDGNRITVVAPGRPAQEIPVVLEKTTNHLEVEFGEPASRKQWSGTLDCYELKSTDPQSPYSWSFWFNWRTGDLQLRSDSSGRNYLVSVVQGRRVAVIEVPAESRSQAQALEAAFTGQDSSRITTFTPARCLNLDRSVFMTDYATLDRAYDISVISVARDETGRWVLGLMGPKADQVYTVVGDDLEWRLAE
jgi:hypothetical protein